MTADVSSVLFGDVHAGKSTLAGYLHLRSKKDEALREISRTKRALGVDFDPAQTLAYLVDTAPDERRRTYRTGSSTSKRMHVSTVDLTNLTGSQGGTTTPLKIIDTPGGDDPSGFMLKGMFAGDIGFYCIEARNLNQNIKKILRISAIWFALKPTGSLSFIITKMDEINHDADILIDSIKLIQDEFNQFHLNFVPVSITGINSLLIEERNVINPSYDKFETLCQTMERELQEYKGDYPTKNREFSYNQDILFSSYRTISRDGIGTIHLGKNLGGDLSQGEKVLLSPVYNGSQEPLSASATLHYAEVVGTPVKKVAEGDLCGLGLRVNSPRNLALGEHFIATSQSSNLTGGRFFAMKVKGGFDHLIRPGSLVDALWLGKRISCRVLTIAEDDSEIILRSESFRDIICLPSNKMQENEMSQVILLRQVDGELLCKGSISELGTITAVCFENYSPEDQKWLRTQSNIALEDTGTGFRAIGGTAELNSLVERLYKRSSDGTTGRFEVRVQNQTLDLA